MYVVGTAGHVDHGKSTLVKALTGIDPDRLKEEKEREMTIDLGFAWLTLPNGERVGIVDVPGHKDFIENMLAGVGGIDAAILVIAADEGVMPQTKEHLAILDLLQVKAGLIALTKIDLVEDKEWLEIVQEEVRETVKRTVLENAPIIPTSAKTGEGLGQLVQALQDILSRTPPRIDLGKPRLPIDRVFTISGFGTVVTGTLVDGSLQVGQEVEILPQGLRARIRGLQSYKQKIQKALPGSRVAVNLSGVDKEQISRGDVLTIPGWLTPTNLVDVHLRYLADAPFPLSHSSQVKFFSGSAEAMAKVRLLDREELKPGEEAFVQLVLEKPIPLVKGDGFIIRWPSPAVTVGGGKVLDPHPGKKHRRFRPEVIEKLKTLALGTPEEVFLSTLRAKEPARFQDLLPYLGLERGKALEILHKLVGRGEIVALKPESVGEEGYLLTKAGWDKLLNSVIALVEDYHQRYPLRKGMSKEELRSKLRITPSLLGEVLAKASAEGKIREEEGVVALPSHEVKFTPEQKELVEKLLARFKASPYATPSVAECEAALGSELFSALLDLGTLVKVSPEVVFLAETYKEMVRRVVERLEKEGKITVAQVRDMFGTSRKYALALMEHLDERKITKRVGDERILLQKPVKGL